MKRFRFQQEHLLRLQKQFLRQADLQVKQASFKAEQARMDIQQLEQDFAEQAARLSERGSAFSRDDLRRARCLGDYVRDRKEHLRKLLAQAEVAYEQALEHRRTVATDVESLKALRNIKWTEYCTLRNTREAADRDEIVMNRWFMAQQGEEQDHG